MKAAAALALLALATCATGPRAEPREPAAACEIDSDCVATVYLKPVASVDDCYCPGCPGPLRADQARLNESEWKAICDGGWAEQEPCKQPDCARPPGAPGCREHACVWVVRPDDL